jgi:Heterokaryon incompatibility protein (HET)
MANTTTQKNTYQYRPLEPDEIRLFRLYSGLPDSELLGRLETYRLVPEEEASDGQPTTIVQRDDGRKILITPDYEALSYLWGDGPFVTSLAILEADILYYLPIKEHLRDALLEFRKELKPDFYTHFWIDAICMNQGIVPERDLTAIMRGLTPEQSEQQLRAINAENEELRKRADAEKSVQIGKMADIYKQAYNVRVWLGKTGDNSNAAMSFIRRFLELDDLDKLSKKPASADEWDAFSCLMRRPWFRRRWIVQEIAFARYATVHCGSQFVTWTEFSDAVSLFSLKHMDVNLLFQQSVNFAHNPNYLGEVEALGAKVLVETLNTLFKKSEDQEVIEHRLPLEALMSSLTAFDASRPHDIIYAILRMSYDTKPGTKSLPQVAYHHAPSPRIGATTPGDLGSSFILDGPPSQEPDRYGPPSRAGTQGSVESQNGLSGSVANLLALPLQQANIKHGSHRRKNSGVKAAIAKKQQEAQSASGELESIPITVDYEKSIFEVCKDFLEHVIGRSRSLDIICVPWAPKWTKDSDLRKNLPQMPSWIKPVSGRPFGLESRNQGHTYGRKWADPLVGTPGTGYQNYSASGKTRAYRGSGEPPQLIRDYSLITCGFILDTIEDMEPSMNAIIPSSWLRTAGWSDTSEPVPDRFWRTLVADRATEGPNPAPGYFSLACKWAFGRIEDDANLDTGKLLTGVYGECPSIAVTFLRRVQAVIWNRSLFLSKGTKDEKGEEKKKSWLLGLAPEEARKGDFVCILYGCSVPVVLRRKAGEEDLAPPKRSMTVRVPRKRTTFVEPQGSNKPSPQNQFRADTQSFDGFTDGIATPKGSPAIGSTPSPLGSPPLPISPQTSNEANWNFDKQGAGKTAHATPTSLKRSHREYILIGPCYVHGMMDGDGFRHQIETGNKLQEFRLV